MKRYIVIILFLLTTTTLKAQTWNEWFRQRKTQIKYLNQQIAALKVYGDYTRKGYEIADMGLTLIRSIKEGDLLEHQDYFKSLGHVKAKVKSYWKVAEILALTQEILKVHKKHNNLVAQSPMLSQEETDYLSGVFIKLLKDCNEVAGELILLTTDYSFEMKDDERIRRINALHADMQDKYVFARYFESQEEKLAIQRLQEKEDVRTSRLLYGMN